MSAETQAGLGSIAVLVFEVLWWGGLLGVLALLALSHRAHRSVPRPSYDAPQAPAPPRAEQWPLRVALALGAAAAVHLVMAPAHLADGPAHAIFFLLAGCVVLWQGCTVLEAWRRLPSPLPPTWRSAVPRAWSLETAGVAGLTGLVAVLPWSGGHG